MLFLNRNKYILLPVILISSKIYGIGNVPFFRFIDCFTFTARKTPAPTTTTLRPTTTPKPTTTPAPTTKAPVVDNGNYCFSFLILLSCNINVLRTIAKNKICQR